MSLAARIAALITAIKGDFDNVAARVTTLENAGGGNVTLVVTPSADQDDYNPNGLDAAKRLGLNPSASIVLSGMATGIDGREVTISNRSSDFIVVLEHQGTGSLAANRFDLPNGFPLFLTPGDRVTFVYSETSSKWQVNSASFNLSQMGLTEFTDFVGCVATANNGNVGPFGVALSGTGASVQPSSYLANATEKPLGAIQLDTGTTATGRALIGSTGLDHVIRGAGCVLTVSRVAIEALPSAAETFTFYTGIGDFTPVAVTDSACWEMRWDGTTADWQMHRSSNSVSTRSAPANVPTADTNYIWLAVFMNPAWTRADYFFSTDSINWTKADSVTTGLPAAGRNSAVLPGLIMKTVGTTQRNASLDLFGYRADYVRG